MISVNFDPVNVICEDFSKLFNCTLQCIYFYIHTVSDFSAYKQTVLFTAPQNLTEHDRVYYYL